MARSVSCDSTSENIKLRITIDQETDDCTNKTIHNEKDICIPNCLENKHNLSNCLKDNAYISDNCRNTVGCFRRNQDGDCNRCEIRCNSCINTQQNSLMECVGPQSTEQGMCQYGSSCCTGSSVELCANDQPCSTWEQQAQPECSCSNIVASSTDCCNSVAVGTKCCGNMAPGTVCYSNVSSSSECCNNETLNTGCCTNVEANTEDTSCCQLNRCKMLEPPATSEVTCNCTSISRVCGDVKLPCCIHQQPAKQCFPPSNAICQTCATVSNRAPCCCYRGDNLSEASSNNAHTILLTGAQTNSTVQGTTSPCCCCSNCIVIPYPISRNTANANTISSEDKDNVNAPRQSICSRKSFDIGRSKRSMDDYDLSGNEEAEPISSAKRKSKVKRRSGESSGDEGDNTFDGSFPSKTRSSYLLKQRKGDVNQDEDRDVFDGEETRTTRRSILKHRSDGFIEEDGENEDDDENGTLPIRTRSYSSRHRKSELLSDEDGHVFDGSLLSSRRSSVLKQRKSEIGNSDDDNEFDDAAPPRIRSSMNRQSKGRMISDEDGSIYDTPSPPRTRSSIVRQFGPTESRHSILNHTTDEDEDLHDETFPSRTRSSSSRQRRSYVSTDDVENGFVGNDQFRRQSSLFKPRQSRRYDDRDEDDLNGTFPSRTRSSLSRRKSDVNTDEACNVIDSRTPSRIRSSVPNPRNSAISARNDGIYDAIPSRTRSSIRKSTDEEGNVFDGGVKSRRQSSLLKKRKSEIRTQDNEGYDTFPTGSRSSLSRQRNSINVEEEGKLFDGRVPSRMRSSLLTPRQSEINTHEDEIDDTLLSRTRSSVSRRRKSDVSTDEDGNDLSVRVPSRRRSSLIEQRKSDTSSQEDENDASYPSSKRSSLSVSSPIRRSILKRKTQEFNTDEDESNCVGECVRRQSGTYSDEDDNDETFPPEFNEDDDMFEVPVPCRSGSSSCKQRKSEELSDEFGSIFDGDIPSKTGSTSFKKCSSRLSTGTDDVDNIPYDRTPSRSSSSMSTRRNSGTYSDADGNVYEPDQSRRRSSILKPGNSGLSDELVIPVPSRKRSSLRKQKSKDVCECVADENPFEAASYCHRSSSNLSISEGRSKHSILYVGEEPHSVENSYSSQEDDDLNDNHVDFGRNNSRDSSKSNSENDMGVESLSTGSTSSSMQSDKEPGRKHQKRSHSGLNDHSEEVVIPGLDEIDPNWTTGLNDKISYFVIKSNNNSIFRAIPIENTLYNNKLRVSPHSITDDEYYESEKDDNILEKRTKKRNLLPSIRKSVIRDSDNKNNENENSNKVKGLRDFEDKDDRGSIEILRRDHKIPRNNSSLEMEITPDKLKSKRLSAGSKSSFEENEYMLKKNRHDSEREYENNQPYNRNSRKNSSEHDDQGRESLTTDAIMKSTMKRIQIPIQPDAPKRHLRVSFVDISPSRSFSEVRKPSQMLYDDRDRLDRREFMLREIGKRTFQDVDRNHSQEGFSGMSINMSDNQHPLNVSEVEEDVRDTVFYLTNINNTGNPFLSDLNEVKMFGSKKRSH